MELYPENLHINVKEITIKQPKGIPAITVKYSILVPKESEKDKIVDFRYSASKFVILEECERTIVLKRVLEQTNRLDNLSDTLDLLQALSDIVKGYLERIYGEDSAKVGD
jgi:hypothetical protein